MAHFVLCSYDFLSSLSTALRTDCFHDCFPHCSVLLQLLPAFRLPILLCSSSQGITDTHLTCESYLLDVVASFDPTELSFLFEISSPFNVSAFLPPDSCTWLGVKGSPPSLGVKFLSAPSRLYFLWLSAMLCKPTVFL